jgi:hypothetical protein
MPDPKQPTAAEKLMMLQTMGQQMVASGQAPSPQVQVALRSFQTAPTPEEIQKVADDMVRGGNPAAAVEFQAYASAMAGPQNKLRQDAQARANAGVGPSPPVVEALNSFDEPPTPQEIQTIRRFLQKKHGEAVGQEFETYAATALAQQAQRPPAPPPQPATPSAAAGVPSGEQMLVQKAKDVAAKAQNFLFNRELEPAVRDVGQGVAHIATLGGVPAPDSIISGNDRMRGMVGLEPLQKTKPKERQGKTEGYDDKKRDLNKERDLLNEAKKI